jgi:branched-chain amino acid transport system permease protein
MYFGQLLVLGLLDGAVLSLVAIGFTLVLGVGKIANFAHGAFVAVGMYIGYEAYIAWHISPYLTLLPALVFFALIGFVMAEVFEQRGRKVGEVGELLVGLALLLLINGLLELFFTDNPKTLSGVDIGGLGVFGITIQWTQIVAGIFAFVLAGGLHVFIHTSRWGRALRATAEDPVVAGLYGVRVPMAQRAAVTLSIIVAGLAGVMIAPFTVLTPDIGTTFLISAFAVVVLGGIGNTRGAVLAGLFVGVVDSMAAGYLSSYWTTLAPLIIILGYLLIWPNRVTA